LKSGGVKIPDDKSRTGQGAVEVPGEGEAAVFVVVEALEFL
jgi:hypothetical protein